MIQARLQINGEIRGRETISGNINGSIKKIYPELENIEINPSKEKQKFKSEKYGYNEITVNEVTSNIDKNIKPQYIKEGISILGVEGGYKGIETSDATATASDILENKTAYANGEKIIGNIKIYDGTSVGGTTENEYNAIVDAHPVGTLDAGAIIVKLPTIDCSEVDSLEYAFNFCMATEYDLINFQHLDSMYYTFADSFNLLETPKIDTSSIKNMEYTFYECINLIKVNWMNTSNVENMACMFGSCEKLKEIALLDMQNVINAESMFLGCISLVSVPQFNTKKLKIMRFLFSDCTNLKDVPQLDASNVIDITCIFVGCENLINLGGLFNLGKAYTEKTANFSYYTLDLNTCNNLTHDSLISVINNLYDLNLTYDVANGGTLYTQTLNLGSINKAKLTAEEINIAINKGWTVS